MPEITWTSYLRYRATRRGFDLDHIENILRFSSERYYDVETGWTIVVGKHAEQLVIISYEQSEGMVTPITIHETTRQQIRFRIRGCFKRVALSCKRYPSPERKLPKADSRVADST